MEEHILAIPETVFPFKPGISPINLEPLKWGSYHKRSLIEPNTFWKQVVVYAKIKRNNRYLVYKRKKGDSRLIRKMSVGIGGHVCSDDAAEDCLSTLRRAMQRELKEELGLEIEDLAEEYMIYDDTTEVSRAHVGVVYKDIDITDKRIHLIPEIGMNIDFLTIQELKKAQAEGLLETWSSIIISNMS